jgi:amino acid adenylation domain-containing protein
MASLLHQLVSEQSQQRPDAAALVLNEERVSYGELEAQSNRLARLLQAAGCVRGDRVCFLMPKSPTAILCQVGILKADCAYVPLDSSSPAERLARIVASCEPRVILVAGSGAKLLGDVLAAAQLSVAPVIGWLDANAPANLALAPQFTRDDLASQSAEAPETRNTGEDIAHILFTSGSTGVPKGVMIKHANVLAYLDWAVKYFGTTPADRVSGHPPLHFDLSTYDIFHTFLAGATLFPVPTELNLLPHKICDFIRTNELTQWFSVPSLLTFMAKQDVVRQDDFPTLKRLMWCGEVFPTPPLRYWMQRLPHVQFTNLYGPTEATIASSYYTMPACPADDAEQVPIGTACDGEELLILNDEMKPCPAGEIGQLYIRGIGLSPGYWRDEEKTKSVFLPNPADPADRIYRTGDLAKWGEDGLVYFIGRADSQIKSRGYRIELGEIETALNALGMTQDCAVVAIESGGFEGAIICSAFTPLEGVDATPASLRTAVSKKIPSYMIPQRWMRLEKMPLNVNGKYDRRMLKEMFQETEAKVK